MSSSKGNMLVPILVAVSLILATTTLYLYVRNQPSPQTVEPPPPSPQSQVIVPPPPPIQPPPPQNNTLLKPPPPAVVIKSSTDKLHSSLCPVEFTVPAGKILIKSKNQYGLWQVQDQKDQRFMFLPRSEEANGRRTTIELRAEGQIYYNPQVSIDIYCQDNPNNWSSETMMEYVVKADFLKSTSKAKIKLWGRDVYVLTYVRNGVDYSETAWFFAKSGLLFRVDKYIGDEDFRPDIEKIFTTLTFL